MKTIYFIYLELGLDDIVKNICSISYDIHDSPLMEKEMLSTCLLDIESLIIFFHYKKTYIYPLYFFWILCFMTLSSKMVPNELKL